MIINDADFMSVRRLPLEYEPPAVVDSNAVVALEVPLEELEAIARRRPKVPQVTSGIEHIQLLQRRPDDFGRIPAGPPGLPPVKRLW
jgi:hypothetical protein